MDQNNTNNNLYRMYNLVEIFEKLMDQNNTNSDGDGKSIKDN